MTQVANVDYLQLISDEGYYAKFPVFSGYFGVGPAKTSPDAEERCRMCQRELCHTLDAYYGKDPQMAGLCTKCRHGATRTP